MPHIVRKLVPHGLQIGQKLLENTKKPATSDSSLDPNLLLLGYYYLNDDICKLSLLLLRYNAALYYEFSILLLTLSLHFFCDSHDHLTFYANFCAKLFYFTTVLIFYCLRVKIYF